jgi:predicted ATPase
LRRGFSQEGLAERAGISPDAVSSLERGARRAPYRPTLALLIAALELDEAESFDFESAAARGRARARAVALERAANNLPIQLSSFIGRERDIAEIRQLLGEHRLVSVIGAGGIGKTRVALRVATHLLDLFEEIWFVDLASLRDEKLIPAAILSALNVPESPNRSALESLITNLKNKERVLLILDNCEHLIHGAAIIGEAILQRCPGVAILATSREVLGVGGECVVRLPTLPVPDAVALFIDRASATDSRLRLVESLESTVAEICERLDGIALAIELAAARVNILSPSALARNLNERFLILTGGKRTAPPRHRTLRAMLDWSYELLEEQEQRALRKLSVFVGGFTLELANEPLEVLSSLVDKSLIQLEVRYDTTRYRLLESTRQYAKEKLRESNEIDSVERAHALSILVLVERFNLLNFISDHAWKTQALPEIENWRAALEWAFGPRGDVLVGQRLAGALNDIWFTQAAAEGMRLVCHAIGACNETTPLDVQAKLQLAQVIMSYPLGRAQIGATLAAAERALTLYQEARDPLGVAAAQVFIGEQLLFKGRVAESEQLLRTALAAAEASDARRLVAMATRYLGIARGFAGDLDAARQLIRESLAMYRAGGAISSEKAIQGLNLAEFEFRAGNAEGALEVALESVESHREYNHIFTLCGVLNNAAAYAVALTLFEEARGYAREALGLASDGGFNLQFAWASQHLAAIAAFAQRNFVRSARVLGFVDARLVALERQRGFTEQQEYDKLMQLLREEVGAELAELLHEGARWSDEQALDQVSLLL